MRLNVLPEIVRDPVMFMMPNPALASKLAPSSTRVLLRERSAADVQSR